jgi:hypothetical protein
MTRDYFVRNLINQLKILADDAKRRGSEHIFDEEYAIRQAVALLESTIEQEKQ